jgi:hypothetical protein
LDEKAAPPVILTRMAESFARGISIVHRRAYGNIPSYAMPAKQDDIA